MAKCLHLNTDKVWQDYFTAMSACIDRLLERYYIEVASAMRTSGGRQDLTIEKLNEPEKRLLKRKVIGGALAVMDSWGTGSLMDTGNKALNDYFASHMYNPERPQTPGAPITGRPQGEYTNIFGERAYSSGKLAGVNLENFPGSPIRPQPPSGAFQNADKWFEASGVVKDEIDKATKDFFAGMRARMGVYWSFY